MDCIAFLFPGQGSQFPGMGNEVLRLLGKQSDELIERANEVTKIDTRMLITDAYDNCMLHSAEMASIGLFLTSALYLKAAKVNSFSANYIAGHSFGEYAALYGADTLGFERGLYLARCWGSSMERMALKEGKMIAVIGLPLAVIEECANCYDEVWIANNNSEFQTVLSGSSEQVSKITTELVNLGAYKVKELPVVAAFHTPLMKRAAEYMQEEIMKSSFSAPNCFVVPNSNLSPTKEVETLKSSLIYQVTGGTNWLELIKVLRSNSVSVAYEIGAGDTLRKIVSTITSKIRFKKVI